MALTKAELTDVMTGDSWGIEKVRQRAGTMVHQWVQLSVHSLDVLMESWRVCD